MRFEKIELNVPYDKAGIEKQPYQPRLDAYLLDSAHVPMKRPAVIVCPGGGYAFTSEREGEPVALQYAAAGCQAFVLWYSVAPDVWPTALLELAASVAYVRSHASEWDIDPDGIMVEGFSAGGHLAASLATFWDQEFVWKPLGVEKEAVKPNGAILSYPVITSGEFAHRGSFENLLGDGSLYGQGGPKPRQMERLDLVSLEKHAGAQNPPTFLWHTYNDPAVPVENSLLLVEALRKAGISVELHIFPDGPHGLSLANRETASSPDEKEYTAVQPWMELSCTWIRNLKS